MSRENVLTKVIELVGDQYVFEIKAQEVAERLRANESHYCSLVADEAFAEAITRDMFEITRDNHLALTLRQERTLALPPVATTIMLENSVVLIKLTRFPSVHHGRGAEAIKEIANAFMAAERASRVIIDLRDNPGGDGSSVALATSYLVSATPQLLAIYRYRGTSSDGENWTWQKLPHEINGPSRPLADKPIVVIVNKNTFSAAEEFAYNLQQMKRATIVGEPTKGGAHPSKRHLIEGLFVLSLPFAETINPISKTNWEGLGIIPDLECSGEDALRLAMLELDANVWSAPNR